MDKRSLVMIIDDEKDLVEMLAYQFKARGYDTVTALNGLEGLEKLATVKPDLIVLDMNMPKMSGVEFYQQICDSAGHTPYPVLVLTARANMEQLFRDLAVDGFMAKPFEVDELIREAEIIINKHNRVVETAQLDKVKVLRNVYVIDNDPEMLNSIAVSLLNAGYRVASANSGTAGLELLNLDAPTLAVVKLNLPDISGDLVALRALRMAKTSMIKFLLYEKRDIRHLQSVRHQIADKTGVIDLVEFDSPDEILHAVDLAIQNGIKKAQGNKDDL